MTLAAASTVAMAQAAKPAPAGKSNAANEHAGHSHGGGKYAALVSASSDCGRIAQICLSHTLGLLGQGDKVMAACAVSVTELLATCDALMKLAASNSKYTPKMAALTLTVCQDCEKECRKHEKTHQECKDCADACAACATECKKVAA